MNLNNTGRLVFFDIDGTLAMPGDPPSDAVVNAIRTLRRNGHLAFLCTGRAEIIVPEKIAAIGFDGGIYSAGGRAVIGDTEISSHPMPEETVRRVAECMRGEDTVFYVLETRGANYCGGTNAAFASPAFAGASTELMRVMQVFLSEGSRDVSEYDGEPVYKISFFCAPRERMDRLEKRLGEFGKVVRFDNMSPDSPLIAAEITYPGTDKGTALVDICRKCGADQRDSIGFGDSMNDAEMLAAAGIGVAMGNSEPRVKAIADRICETCAEDGVAKELERLGLI